MVKSKLNNQPTFKIFTCIGHSEEISVVLFTEKVENAQNTPVNRDSEYGNENCDNIDFSRVSSNIQVPTMEVLHFHGSTRLVVI